MSARSWHFGAGLAATLALSLGATGCDEEAFCFADCGGETDGPTTASTTGGGGEGGCLFCTPTGGGGQGSGGGGETGGGGSTSTSDCPGADLEEPKTCGTCDNDCTLLLSLSCQAGGIGCEPSPNPGLVPGFCTCAPGSCSPGKIDCDANDGIACELPCTVKTPGLDAVCDHDDDDCDCVVDEDVDFCADAANCGVCGRTCSGANAIMKCVSSAVSDCDASNTACEIDACEPGFVDLDGLAITGCEYPCTAGPEVCNGEDDDCDGEIDDSPTDSGAPCFGAGAPGCVDPAVCACLMPEHEGTSGCVGGQSTCEGPDVIDQNDELEVCDGIDNDCDGVVDDSPTDLGSCGVSNFAPCSFGLFECVSGAKVCVGDVPPLGSETCNGIDDDCSGTIDDNASDVGTACNVAVAPPPGATSACTSGTSECIAGQIFCQGSVGPAPGATDTCNVDANCDGQLTDQPDLQTDAKNCGACGNDCESGKPHTTYTCVAGACQFQACDAGYFDADNTLANGCEYACSFVSATESCNGVDDDCDGQIDDGVVTPSPVQVCGVSPAASAAECTTQVSVACVSGALVCSFPAGVCTPTCSGAACANACKGATEICDGLDNDCDGALNENVASFGAPCMSPGFGACRQPGTLVCDGPSATKCSAAALSCSALPGGCAEACDGKDNDCDGSIDEPFSSPGADGANFVRPTVTQIGASLWITSYEVSRPNATAASSGTGNGFHTSAPAGSTLDKTPACSVSGRLPWFNVSPEEVEQTCTAAGGSICATTDWQSACEATASCTWGYAPRTPGTACTTTYTGIKYCNLGPSFDFDLGKIGDQDGLLATGAPVLAGCWADWSGLLGNVAETSKIFDVTGNLREITKSGANEYRLVGGSFDTQSADGATCGFEFYTVTSTFKFFDTGFRCCFSQNPG